MDAHRDGRSHFIVRNSLAYSRRNLLGSEFANTPTFTLFIVLTIKVAIFLDFCQPLLARFPPRVALTRSSRVKLKGFEDSNSSIAESNRSMKSTAAVGVT